MIDKADAPSGVARERCRQYWCPTVEDFECAVRSHRGFDVCCDRVDLHRDVPGGPYCTNSPPQRNGAPPPAPGLDPFPAKVRLEFEMPGRDMYYAAKDIAGAVAAGWTPAECWLLSGEVIPRTWDWMCHHFGYEYLIAGTVLIPGTEVRDLIEAALRRAADAELLADPVLQESLAQMRRGEGIKFSPRSEPATSTTTTSEEDAMPG